MARAVLLALLVGLALPLGVAGAPTHGGATGDIEPSIHDVAILTLGGDARTGFVFASMDVATAVAVQREAADAELERYALAERYDRTVSSEARKALLFEAATSVEIEVATLQDDERALRTAYAEREIDTGTYLRRLALIHARAGQLERTLARIQMRAVEIPRFSLRSRVSLLDASMFGFEGPVRAQALAAFVGDRPPNRIYVEASEQGVVLSTIEDDRFIRTAYRADNRQPETVSSRSLNYAVERTSELYPVAYNTSSFRTGIDTLAGGLFLLDIEIREGRIRAYLDGGTEEVFFEIQERRLDLLGPRPAATGAANGTRLVVNRTYPGGPLQIAVADNATGEPLAATVYVDGDRVETGPDGTVWTLAPSGVTYQVRAVGPGGNVTIDVRPLSAPTVGG